VSCSTGCARTAPPLLNIPSGDTPPLDLDLAYLLEARENTWHEVRYQSRIG
jgi:hypothetical protein